MTADRDNTPFFLLGCVRSGTTLLRNLIREHPRLESPEETHFFRWADPFGTSRYRNVYLKSRLMKAHREMDGVAEEDFASMLDDSLSRRDLMDAYGKAFLKAKGNPEGRWFDKTPQHVYGALLIREAWPKAKFVHIHRHPLNVVASLMEGAVMPVHDFNSAINYWNEAAAIMLQLRQLFGDRLMEISYSALTEEPQSTVNALLGFLGEDIHPTAGVEQVRRERNKYRKKLGADQVSIVLARTARYLEVYGYGDAP